MDSKALINNIQEWLHLKDKANVEGLLEPPTSSEIFTADQMEQYGISLALTHELTQEKTTNDMLLHRLFQCETTLRQSCEILMIKKSTECGYIPAKEWLLDNFYLIQEQILSIRRYLPKGYGRTLPKLANRLPGFPRIYDISAQVIEHGDGHWDLENLTRFIKSYQSVTPLTLGELWAIPITLGVALIENLSNSSRRIVADITDHNLAAFWADSMLEVATTDPKKLVLIIADMARSEPVMNSAFVSELSRRLQGAALALPLSFVEQHLAEEGLSIEQLILEENKCQASNQVRVSNSIAGLRLLGEVDWHNFVEEVSIVEQILRTDSTDTYKNMDFGTRDRYRHVIERLSRVSTYKEQEIAACAIQLAKIKTDNIQKTSIHLNPESMKECHVGYYLIGDGLSLLENALNIQYSPYKVLCKFFSRWSIQFYSASIIFITFALTLWLLNKAYHNGINTISLVILFITISVCVSQLAVSFVNLISTLLVKPESLPRMDFTKGVPASYKTLVVVPAMLGSISAIETLVEALEVRFLGNRDKNIYFALLTDFNDALQQKLPEDEALLTSASAQIIALNKKYSKEGHDIFFLFHRPRLWNARENVWMGKERKRGKLEDLNNLLTNGLEDNFLLIIGDTTLLHNTKYVITLDSDTQLPRETARQFVGTMAHPLNMPKFDAHKQCVIDGYGILQPRVAEALSSNGLTRYAKLCGNEFGFDPYTRAVSDVYQDLFHEGSFIGKGIYDVDVFQKVLGGRFPENHILSHDLLEGCYLRSGFLSDVPLYEKSPANYITDMKRRIRWIRGDWQLVPWLFSKVLNGKGDLVHNPLSYLSKLKLFDNLRRSFVPIALLVLLGLNWTILPPTYFWLVIIIAIVIFPAIINTLIEGVLKPNDRLPSQHFTNMVQTSMHRFEQFILYLACLPQEAWYSLMATVRTCWRVLISKRNLLEWTPSDQIDQKFQNKKTEWIANLWMGPLSASIAGAILITNGRLTSFFFAIPLLSLWLISPIFLRWLSQPIPRVTPNLDRSQIRFIHKMARKTWGFFETFMTEENNWLPPDNYQEAPIEVLARRTSPTNIGLALLANLTAYDFGYININQLLKRIDNTMQTMSKLERYRGHFYNWYSTETLSPLIPRYISSVDSGNLAGHLLTLRQGLLALPDEPLLNSRYLDGLEDACELLADNMLRSSRHSLSHFQVLLQKSREMFSNWPDAFKCSNDLCNTLEEMIKTWAHDKSFSAESRELANMLLEQSIALRSEISFFAGLPQITTNTTLREISSQRVSDILVTEASSTIILEAKRRIALIESLSAQVFLFSQMDISFLYDNTNHLMSIGFNADDQRLDASYYDLLSSEARLSNFVAISQGQILQESWFSLGRILVANNGDPVLTSWSGSMFEYLMPLLVMPTYHGTLLDQTYHAAVRRQISYGKQKNVPWGISESGYNAFDIQFNYLYRAFGVPGLGLKRGLEDDLVIAPYASAMALMIAPEASCKNLQEIYNEYPTGRFGFYESIDFTPARLPRDSKSETIRSFMAHHQGMIFLAFSYLLHEQPMQRRFESEPTFQSSLLLLQERVPKPTASYLQIPKSPEENLVAQRPENLMRIFHSPHTRTPQVQLLSNGSYNLVITQAGGGYSRWKNIAITRWREDSTCDNWGIFGYIKDIETGEFCSSTYQPTAGSIESFRTVFSEAEVEFNLHNLQLHMHTDIVVSPEDDIELRRLRIHNHSKSRRVLEFTSYAEIALAPVASDLQQPSFNNLFIETEILSEKNAIIATRRPQTDQQISAWLSHHLIVHSKQPHSLSFETDRTQFLGRGYTIAKPRAMVESGELSNTEGAVLDPIIAIRCRFTLEPNDIVTLDLFTGIADSKEHCIALVEKYQDYHLANRIFGLAWTHGQVLLHQLNISGSDAQLYGKIASAIIYTSSTRRADRHILESNRRGQTGLWGYSISGDLPIVILQIEEAENLDLVRQLIQAQAYWRRKGLFVDLVILNKEHVSYRQTLQEQIMSLVTTASSSEQSGSIVVRIVEQVPSEDIILLQSVARIIISDTRGTLSEQLSRRRITPPLMPLLNHTKTPFHYLPNKLYKLPNNLQFFNGFGGFSSTGDEYIIRLTEGASTPAPWVNVLANPNFGTLVSEGGQGYTWAENAHEFRLTPWENDPLLDSGGEAFYIRDDESGKFWSPTPLPRRGQGDYQIRHGFGYSVFEHVEEGIFSELTLYVALDASIKFVELKIRNDSNFNRQISGIGYISWVLGDLRSKNAMHIVTDISPTGAIIAQNHYNTEFSSKVAFFDATTSNLDLNERTVTGDRTEFIGRNGTLQEPLALKHKRLSGRVGAGFDPCAAIHLAFDLSRGQSRTLIFTLGVGNDKQEVEALIQQFRSKAADATLNSVREYWKKTLNVIQIKTKDPAIDILANGWLLYQVISSRLWGRSGYYQSGGAFGFRDQLQDVMALAHAAPNLFRAQILLCAEHQFEEGDVLHWWHPPHNRGVRTRCSDDYLWLPFVLCNYIETTGDMTILDESIPFIEGRPLKPEEESYYELPTIGTKMATVYQHAVRAIKHGFKMGQHGLPLMGSGDWNDGMNLVGIEGRGESVWLAFFLYDVLQKFCPIATRYGDSNFAGLCETEKNKLQQHIEAHGWDGKWYRRAYFDDGTPLGSSSNSECKIDSIAQSWAVLSSAADPKRAEEAMKSLSEYLVDENNGLIKLLVPPFDTSLPNPGYIKGYVPGIRENGGQYTHAAVWAAMAFAKLGEIDLAWKLLNMLNPINHGQNIAKVERYKIEPYVLAGDIYSVTPHVGRGGWSWYTGSAGWLYRLILETLLGLQIKDGNKLYLKPLLPDTWDSFTANYTYGDTVYSISIERKQDKSGMILDGIKQSNEEFLPLVNDHINHSVVLYIN